MPESVETPAPVKTAARRPRSVLMACSIISVDVVEASGTVVTVIAPFLDRFYSGD